MKKNICSLLMILFLISFARTNEIVNASEGRNNRYEYRYETCGNNLSKEEARKENERILAELSTQQTRSDPSIGDPAFEIDVTNVISHLQTIYPSYSWSFDNKESVAVSDVYEGNPVNMNENAGFIARAKEDCEVSGKLGCGVIAMIGQMEYLANSAGYVNLISNPDEDEAVEELCEEVIEETWTFHINDDTATLPEEFKESFIDVLKAHNMTNPRYEWVEGPLGEELVENIFYDDSSQLVVNCDTIVNSLSSSTNINNIKDSIDRGMPVIMCTSAFPGVFSWHYFNIYGYQTFIGTDANGNTIEHLLFNIHMNWGGISNDYMDSRLLENYGYWLFYFEEVHEKNTIRHDDYNGILNTINQTATTKQHIPTVGNNFKTNYLRASYQDFLVTIEDETDNNQETHFSTVNRNLIVLSPLSSTVGTAYFEYQFDIPIRRTFMELNWLSIEEIPNDYEISVQIQYKNSTGSWVTFYDVLEQGVMTMSSNFEYPTKLDIEIPNASTNLRVFIQASNFTAEDNTGEIVIQNAMFTLNEHDYRFNYVYLNDDTHTVECMCDNIITEQHEYSYIYYDDNYHTKLCECGQSFLAPHNWVLTRLRSGGVLPNYVVIYECSYCKTISMGPVQNV